MNKLLDSTSLLVLSLDTCLIVCNTQKNRRLEVNYIVAGLWSIFGSRLLSEGNPVLCQLILRIRNSAQVHVSFYCTNRRTIKNNRKGRKKLFVQEFFSFVQVVCRIFFFWGFRMVSGYPGVWRVLRSSTSSTFSFATFVYP